MNLSARLKNAIIRIAGLCPFYNNPWNIYDREKFHLINNAINELNVAFADHADDVERKAIGIFELFRTRKSMSFYLLMNFSRDIMSRNLNESIVKWKIIFTDLFTGIQRINFS